LAWDNFCLFGKIREVTKQYEGLYGKEYLDGLRRQDRVKPTAEVEAVFEQAADKYGDVKLPFGGTSAITPKPSSMRSVTSLSASRRPVSKDRTRTAFASN
jgi:hypothetical protein